MFRDPLFLRSERLQPETAYFLLSERSRSSAVSSVPQIQSGFFGLVPLKIGSWPITRTLRWIYVKLATLQHERFGCALVMPDGFQRNRPRRRLALKGARTGKQRAEHGHAGR